MKEMMVKLVKGESLIYVTMKRVEGLYVVALGGNCGIHVHERKRAAEVEFQLRIGYLVASGYKAELCDA